MNIRCNSCGIPIVGKGYSSFDCPVCGKTVITRCQHCRDQSVTYRCNDCGFTGP